MTRLFIALIIPDEIKEHIVKLREKAFPESGDYKWEPFEKIHLTLKFIGEVDNNIVPKITTAINFVEECKSLNCELTKFGFFFNRKEPRILWMGLRVDEEIFSLVNELNKKLEEFSIPSEKRSLKPHLTLKRFKGNEGKKFISSFENFNVPAEKFLASKIILYKSELLPSGSRYKEIKNYNLK